MKGDDDQYHHQHHKFFALLLIVSFMVVKEYKITTTMDHDGKMYQSSTMRK